MKTLSLADARARLSPTLKQLNAGPVAIKVRGKIAAYLVSKDAYAALTARRRPRVKLRGSMKLEGHIDDFDADAALVATLSEGNR